MPNKQPKYRERDPHKEIMILVNKAHAPPPPPQMRDIFVLAKRG